MILSEQLIHHAEWWIAEAGATKEFYMGAVKHLQTIYKQYPNLPAHKLVQNWRVPAYANNFRCYLCLLEAELQKDVEGEST